MRRRLIDAANGIENYAWEIERASTLPMRKARQPLFLAEAQAAAHYWQGFGALVPGEMGFQRRAHREADDVVNKALNYGHDGLVRRVRSRLRGEAYRLVFIEITANSRTSARWLTADRTGRR